MNNVKNISFVAVLLGVVIVISILTSSGSGMQGAGENSSSSVLTLETEVLPFLEPHEHEDYSDSIFDVDHGVPAVSPVITIEERAWVTGMELVMNGAPQDVLHHALIIDKKHANPVCANVERELATFGLETPPILIFPEPYGMLLQPGDELELQVMLHNGEDDIKEGITYEDVSVSIHFMLEEPSAKRTKPLEMYHISLIDTLCERGFDDGTFNVPANTVSFTRRSDKTTEPNPSRYTFTAPGTILAIGGHLHAWEGGELLNIFLDNELIRTYKSAKTSSGDWTYYVTPQPVLPVPVKAGQEVTLEAMYSNPSEYVVRGAMGMTVLYFAPDNPNDLQLIPFNK